MVNIFQLQKRIFHPLIKVYYYGSFEFLIGIWIHYNKERQYEHIGLKKTGKISTSSLTAKILVF